MLIAYAAMLDAYQHPWYPPSAAGSMMRLVPLVERHWADVFHLFNPSHHAYVQEHLLGLTRAAVCAVAACQLHGRLRRLTPPIHAVARTDAYCFRNDLNAHAHTIAILAAHCPRFLRTPMLRLQCAFLARHAADPFHLFAMWGANPGSVPIHAIYRRLPPAYNADLAMAQRVLGNQALPTLPLLRALLARIAHRDFSTAMADDADERNCVVLDITKAAAGDWDALVTLAAWAALKLLRGSVGPSLLQTTERRMRDLESSPAQIEAALRIGGRLRDVPDGALMANIPRVCEIVCQAAKPRPLTKTKLTPAVPISARYMLMLRCAPWCTAAKIEDLCAAHDHTPPPAADPLVLLSRVRY